ncbi:MAG TPA: hypothetical protein VGN96_09700 [Roseococcus sp.]|jgi:hypothetical protein|nr:hypothetical protein [Roseococcus sp.]
MNLAGRRTWRRRGLPASLSGLLLLGGAALLAGLSGSRAEARLAVAVIAPDGACVARILPAAALAGVETRLAEEAERLAAMAGRLMADAAAARLAEARERVPAFGDWAYGWVQSYVTSYQVLGRMLRGLVAPTPEADQAGWAERLVEEVSQPMREAFGARVLPPDLADGLLADLRHAAGVLDLAWQAALRREAAMLAALEAAAAPGAPVAARLDLRAAGQSLVPDLAVPPAAVGALHPGDAGVTLLRTIRPMAARVGAAVLRASEAGSIVAAAGALGFAMGGASGVALGAAAGMGASWTLDWGLSRLDSALHRGEFEAQALRVLEAAEQGIAAGAQDLAAATLAARRVALRPPARGCETLGAAAPLGRAMP